MVERVEILKTILEKVYKDNVCQQTKKNFNENKLDFIFHMTDWIDDLDTISELYKNPQTKSFKEAEEIIMGFIYHASGHILAAAKLVNYKPVLCKNSSDDPNE